MMHFAGFAGFHDDTNPSPELLLNQMMVNGRNRQQRTDWHVVFIDTTVSQRHQRATVFDRLFGFSTNAIKRIHKPSFAVGLFEGHVDLRGLPTAMSQPMNGGHLIGVQDRRFGKQPSTLFVGRFQQVTFGPDISGHRHHDLFANRIDRRVGNLSKQLAKVIVQQPRLVTQTSERCIVTH